MGRKTLLNQLPYVGYTRGWINFWESEPVAEISKWAYKVHIWIFS